MSNQEDTSVVVEDSKAAKENEFTSEEQVLISAALTEMCVGPKCVSRLDIYNTLADDFKRLGETKFQALLSKSIDSNVFPEFTTRRGRNGGVHKVGAFDEVEKNKATKESKAIKTPVEIDGKPQLIKARAKKLHDFISIVLCGKEDSDGKVSVEGKKYSCDVDIFTRYVNMLDKTTQDTAA